MINPLLIKKFKNLKFLENRLIFLNEYGLVYNKLNIAPVDNSTMLELINKKDCKLLNKVFSLFQKNGFKQKSVKLLSTVFIELNCKFFNKNFKLFINNTSSIPFFSNHLYNNYFFFFLPIMFNTHLSFFFSPAAVKFFQNTGHSLFFKQICIINKNCINLSLLKKYVFLVKFNLISIKLNLIEEVFYKYYSSATLLLNITDSLLFFFQIYYRSLTRKMRKIVKNRYRYTILKRFVKPKKRIITTLQFFKKCSKVNFFTNSYDAVFGIFDSILFDEDSWVIDFRDKQQRECLASFINIKKYGIS